MWYDSFPPLFFGLASKKIYFTGTGSLSLKGSPNVDLSGGIYEGQLWLRHVSHYKVLATFLIPKCEIWEFFGKI